MKQAQVFRTKLQLLSDLAVDVCPQAFTFELCAWPYVLGRICPRAHALLQRHATTPDHPTTNHKVWATCCLYFSTQLFCDVCVASVCAIYIFSILNSFLDATFGRGPFSSGILLETSHCYLSASLGKFGDWRHTYLGPRVVHTHVWLFILWARQDV